MSKNVLIYVPKPHETEDYLRKFFQDRITELNKVKASLEKDKEEYNKELQKARNGSSRFDEVYLLDFLTVICERIQLVDDNIKINQYHLGVSDYH